jgi:hypothetical protein
MHNPKYFWARKPDNFYIKDTRQNRRLAARGKMHIIDQFRAPTEEELLESLLQAYRGRMIDQGALNENGTVQGGSENNQDTSRATEASEPTPA